MRVKSFNGLWNVVSYGEAIAFAALSLCIAMGNDDDNIHRNEVTRVTAPFTSHAFPFLLIIYYYICLETTMTCN